MSNGPKDKHLRFVPSGVSEEIIKMQLAEISRNFHQDILWGVPSNRLADDDCIPKSGRHGVPGGSAPSASYTAARSSVKKWLIESPEQSFDDIVGNDDALALLSDAIRAPVEHAQLHESYGLRPPRGALLSGPPGCGKTMFARAAASEMRRLYGEKTEFLSLAGSELQSRWVGETEERIKAIFTFAREYHAHHGHPLLVFIDEAEVILPDRTSRVRQVHSWEESQVAAFLAEMDGIRESGAFVLLASNRPEVIDQAVLRDGRCDFKITIQRPDAAALRTILERNFTDTPVHRDISAEDLVFAAIEALQDPHKVLMEAHAVLVDVPREKISRHNRHFLLEDIVSGAMAASIPLRARRHAFARDKAAGVMTGVTVADVLNAVNDLFQENKGLDHSYARAEFQRAFVAELQAEADGKSEKANKANGEGGAS